MRYESMYHLRALLMRNPTPHLQCRPQLVFLLEWWIPHFSSVGDNCCSGSTKPSNWIWKKLKPHAQVVSLPTCEPDSVFACQYQAVRTHNIYKDIHIYLRIHTCPRAYVQALSRARLLTFYTKVRVFNLKLYFVNQSPIPCHVSKDLKTTMCR